MKNFWFMVITIILFSGIVKSGSVKPKGSQSKIPVVQSDSTFNILVEYDIVYAEGLSHESFLSNHFKIMPLKLDVYMPDNTNPNRPAFVFIHGGGFYGGSKQQRQIIKWANYFTSRGWVFISIDYRLRNNFGTVPQAWADYSKTLPKQAKIEQFLAIYPAQRDAKAALRWVMARAATYHINPDYLTVGGGSAGAITAISLGISDETDFRDEINLNQDPTLTSTNLNQKYNVRTIINLWGSKFALDAIEEIYGHNRFDNDDPSLFIAHGTEDPKVPFNNAEKLKAIYEANQVPYAYYPLIGKGHGAWNAKVSNKNLEELAFEFITEQQGLIIK